MPRFFSARMKKIEYKNYIPANLWENCAYSYSAINIIALKNKEKSNLKIKLYIFDIIRLFYERINVIKIYILSKCKKNLAKTLSMLK